MRTTLKATIATVIAVAVLVVAGLAGATASSNDQIPMKDEAGAAECDVTAPSCNDTPSGPVDSGDGMAMCLAGAEDCNDVIVEPAPDEPGGAGGSSPGWDGTGTPPSTGSGGGSTGDGGDAIDKPCGVEVVDGDTVSFSPCGNDETPAPAPEPTIVEPTSGMAGVARLPFDSATIGDDGRTLTIDFSIGVAPCYVLDHVDIAYGADHVTVTLYQGHDPASGDVACIEIAMLARTIVTLDQPLGDRTIVDGAMLER